MPKHIRIPKDTKPGLTSRTTVFLDRALWKQVKQLAIDEGVNAQDVVAYSLRELLSKYGRVA